MVSWKSIHIRTYKKVEFLAHVYYSCVISVVFEKEQSSGRYHKYADPFLLMVVQYPANPSLHHPKEYVALVVEVARTLPPHNLT